MVSHFAVCALGESLFCYQVFLNNLRSNPLTKLHPSLSYLIDFEESECDESFKRTTWAALTQHLDDPDLILQQWGLETHQLREKLKKYSDPQP